MVVGGAGETTATSRWIQHCQHGGGGTGETISFSQSFMAPLCCLNSNVPRN